MFRLLRALQALRKKPVRRLPCPHIDWAEVVHILAMKEDVFGPEAVSLCIKVAGQATELLIQPKTAGYGRIIRSFHEHLPGIDPNWYNQMRAEPLPCFERVLYERTPPAPWPPPVR